MSARASVRPHVRTRLPPDRLSWNLVFQYFSKNLSRKWKFQYKLTMITRTLHEDQYAFVIMSRSVLLRMWNVSDKSCRQNQNTHCMFSNISSKNRVFYEITWKNTVELGRPPMTVWRMRIACWLPKATNTQSEYVIRIDFLLQKWLQERASVLRYTYILCLVCIFSS